MMSVDYSKSVHKVLDITREIINLAIEYGLSEQEFCATIAYILSMIYKYNEYYYGYVITASVYLISGGKEDDQ